MHFIKKKIKSFLARRKIAQYQEKLSIAPSAILTIKNLDFRTIPEERTYVLIGAKSVVSFASFIFETSDGSVSIGENVQIGPSRFISKSSIVIEDDVTMAWDIVLYDHDSHSVHWSERSKDNERCYDDLVKYGDNIRNKDWSVVKTSGIRICSKAWIGFGVTILKGVTIGEGAVIGAMSVVTKDVPPWTVAAGNPARVVKQLK